MATKRPIIVIKKKVSHRGHHGGAWKVAYADFVTAMMSLFIVLWLLNSTPQVKQAVAGYFNDPKSSAKETGTDMLGDGPTATNPVDIKSAEKLKQQIEKAIVKQKDLDKLSKQIEITITDEGLRIELIEQQGGTFFESGSAKLSGSGIELLALLSGQLKELPNHLLIEGHTDAQPYANENGYTNWELSADRANAARRLLQENGVRVDQISQVRGYADQLLRVKANPLDPSNRRISLIVQWLQAPAGGGLNGSEKTTAVGARDLAAGKITMPAKANASPANTVPTEGAAVKPAASTSAVTQSRQSTGSESSNNALVSKGAAKPSAAVARPSLLGRLEGLMQGKKKG